MKKRAFLALALGLAATLALVLAMTGGRPGSASSSLSRGASGWLAARLYIESRGTEVSLLDRPLDGDDTGGTLVLAFPLQRPLGETGLEAIQRRLTDGGDLLIAYKGYAPVADEMRLLDILGVGREGELREGTLGPWQWLEDGRSVWTLSPEPEAAELRDLAIRPLEQRLEAPEGSEVFFRGPEGSPAAFLFSLRKGTVGVVPAGAFSNARLAGEGNADLLETLRRRLSGPWAFDEYHHGLVSAELGADLPGRSALDLFVVHLVLLYLLGVLAVARRFGPPWPEPPASLGSAASFFVGLGRLHHELGHHSDGARRLVDRTRELFPIPALPEGLAGEVNGADAGALVSLAGRLVELRRGGGIAARQDRGRLGKRKEGGSR